AAVGEDAGDVGGGGEQGAQGLVAAVDRAGQLGEAVEGGAELRGDPVESDGQGVQGGVQGGGVGSADIGGQLAHGIGERVRRGGAFDRDDIAGAQHPRPGRHQGQYPFAQQGAGFDVGGGAAAEGDPVADGEVDLRVAVVQAQAGDSAHGDAGEHDLVADREPA